MSPNENTDPIGLFRRDAMDASHRRRLFREYVDAKRHAERTNAFGDFEFAALAYRRFMRSYLTDAERAALVAEDGTSEGRPH